jgi:membrane fusion protein (multidrug efflux system)
MSATNSPTSETPANENNGRRSFLLRGLAAIVVIAAIGYSVYYFVHGRWFESTEDAYANGDIVQITPLVAGTIVEISAEDNMLVKAGQALVKFDPNDSEIALAQAEAALARSVRQVRGLYANVGGQSADLAAKQVALDRAREDVERRRGLEASGAIAKEELAHVRAALDSAERALAVSREQLSSTSALIDDTSIATHPDVKAAASMVRRAYLDYARSTLQAPVTGYVTQRHAQLGQRVTTGTPLMALVPLDRLWVDANFKETQIEHMRIGQPVEVRSDLYGGDVIYHGHIASLGIGTGSAMSLLPAQNATGNWIKIVQRVPVRITLDAKELNEHPLRLGMSMRIEVNMHDRSGPVLSQSDPAKPAYATQVYGRQLTDAEARIKTIIHDNSGTVAAVH